MKIGINAWAFPQNMTIAQGFRLAKRAGFDCVELNISEDGYLTPDSDEGTAIRLRELAENISLEVRSLSTGLLWRYPLTANDSEVAERGKDVVRRGLQIARWMGADTLLVVPGIVTEDVPYDVAYERASEAIKELAEVAEKLEVRIGVENVWNRFLLSPLEMRDFVDAVGSSFVGVYFDAGNVVVNGYPEQWVRILEHRIFKVHVKDFRSNIGNAQGFANVLEGDVDWRALKKALVDVGYDDVITAEIPGYKTLPDVGVRHTGERMRRIFKGAG
ncbi:MAG: sugar phosphate isomerase/epimerase family protein [Armatimonadota bacterium]